MGPPQWLKEGHVKQHVNKYAYSLWMDFLHSTEGEWGFLWLVHLDIRVRGMAALSVRR